MLKKRIVFIGAGNMAEALIKGVLDAKLFRKGNITATDVKNERLDYIKKKLKIKVETNNKPAVNKGDIIVLAVKPQNINEVLEGIKHNVKDKLVISIAAGIKTERIENTVGKAAVIRVMPNTPALVKKGMSAIARGKFAKLKDENIADTIFQAVGKVVKVKENLMDAITAVSGSGPAYVFYMMESLIEAGKKSGLSQQVAEILVFQTVLGAAELVLKTGKTPEELRKAVSSPGGTTLAGLAVLEKKGFKHALISAVGSACQRSKELSG
ncbi:MAG: pyrroline-5-carboxylate reductase [bacterium]